MRVALLEKYPQITKGLSGETLKFLERKIGRSAQKWQVALLGKYPQITRGLMAGKMPALRQ
ncbi:hypothetical protein [Dapis sp. BLCC M229]|uniref:hypothetical protein n=1 Tax=Dapis sp. BLCC M229 TaxID=3400188 RepID=UPI003CED92EB